MPFLVPQLLIVLGTALQVVHRAAELTEPPGTQLRLSDKLPTGGAYHHHSWHSVQRRIVKLESQLLPL